MKRIIGIVVFLAVAVLFIPWLNQKAEANPNYNVTVFVAGEQVNFPDQKPYIDEANERTYVPVRFVSEALGATVNWDSVSQAIYIEKPQLKVVLTIGSNEAVVNSVKKTLDAPALLVGDRTMVPLRFVSEALGEKVKWTPGGSGGRVDIRLPAGVVPVVPEERPEVVQFINGLLGGDYMEKEPGHNSWTNWIDTDSYGYLNKDGVTYTFDPPDPRSDRYGLTITYDTDIDNSKKIADIRKILEEYMPDKADEVMDAFYFKRSLILKHMQEGGAYDTRASQWVHSYSENGTYTNMSAMYHGVEGFDFIQLMIIFMK